MSQISPPMRILLAGAVVFLAVWFTLLRPKSDSVEPVAATPTATAPAGNVNTGEPAQSTAGKIVEKAKDTATQAEGAAKAAAGESTDAAKPKSATGSATTTAPAPEAAPLPEVPAATLAKLPTDVAGAIKGHKVLVLAVLADGAKRWRPIADDDRYVRNTLKKVNRYDGDVLVKQVPVSRLYSYGPVVNDLKVNQTPSVVVVDRKLQASVIPGYLDRISINQAIADARGASIDPLITDSYLRKANQTCAQYSVRVDRWSLPTIPGRKAERKSLRRMSALVTEYRRGIQRIAAPARWRGLKRRWVRVMKMREASFKRAVKAHKNGDAAALDALAVGFDNKSVVSLDHRFDAAGLTSCSILRQQ